VTAFDLVGFGLLAVILVVPFAKRSPSRMIWVLAMVPVLNVVTDLTYDAPAAAARSVLVPLRIAVLLGVALYCLYMTPRHNLVTKVILVFLTYLGLLVLLTSNPAQAGTVWMRHFVLMTLFAAGFYLVRDVDRLRILNVGLLASTGLLLLNFVLAQVFGFGRSPYKAETAVYLGGGGIHLVNNFAYFVLLVPVLLLLTRRRLARYAIFAAALLSGVAVLMVMKRISILAMGAGVLVYLVLAPQKERRIVVLLATLGILAVFSPLYLDTVLARSDRLVETNVESDKQSRDWDRWTSDWARSGYSTKVFLVGKDIFLSAEHVGGTQKIHVDYIALLHGGGAVGLTIYMLVFAALLLSNGIRGSPIRRFVFARELRAVSWALVVACFIVGWSSGMSAVTPRGMIFLYTGAIAGLLHQCKLWDAVARQSAQERLWERGPVPALRLQESATREGQAQHALSTASSRA
jgi:hypothetical protein